MIKALRAYFEIPSTHQLTIHRLLCKQSGFGNVELQKSESFVMLQKTQRFRNEIHFRLQKKKRAGSYPSGRIPTHVDTLDWTVDFERLLDHLLSDFERNRSDVNTSHER